MDREIELKLAKKNGTIDALRKEKIISKIKEKYPHLDDEIAVLRKMVVILAKKIKEQHPDIDLSEFEEYNTFVEVCKEQVKSIINGGNENE